MNRWLEELRRWPDVEAPNLHAVDAADRLILDEALQSGPLPPEVTVVGDRYGALTLGALMAGAQRVRVHQDAFTGERALAANAERVGLRDFRAHALEPSLVDGATLVLLQLPRSLAALEEISALIARHADPRVRVFAGGRLKYLTPAMNDTLARDFTSVSASLARQKSRVLRASAPRSTSGPPTWPRREVHRDLGRGVLRAIDRGELVVVAHGAAFAGTGVDLGTRFLLSLVDHLPSFERGIDLACGTGVLATVAALVEPRAKVIASDQSSAAVASCAATVAANGVAERVEVVRDDGLSSQPDDSADLILLNPPFHVGAAVHTGVAERLFADAGRVLAPEGELWCVWNSHLRYRPVLQRSVGDTRQIARNSRFTVTASRAG